MTKIEIYIYFKAESRLEQTLAINKHNSNKLT